MITLEPGTIYINKLQDYYHCQYGTQWHTYVLKTGVATKIQSSVLCAVANHNAQVNYFRISP